MNKALILQAKGQDGCTWYRLENMKRQLHEPLIEFIDVSLPTDLLAKMIESADVFILRLSDLVAFDMYDIVFKSNPKPVIVDIDDNYDVVDPLSEMYHAYGTKEVTLPDGSYLWKDLNNGFSVKKNTARLEKYKNILRNATIITTTTFKLRQYALQFNPNVVVIPNAIDGKFFPEMPRNRDTIDIVWAGGSSHYSDLMEIKEPLVRVLNKYPMVHMHIVGVPFKGFVKDMPEKQIHTYEWLSPDGHGYRLATLRAHIGLCPLKDMYFNYFKSSVKYYEYSALGLATLARNIEPYNDDIVHGRNGMLYSNVAEFETMLDELINDDIKRVQIANNARDYVLNKRNVKDISSDWATLINTIADADRKVVIVPKETNKEKLSVLIPVLRYKELTGSELYVYELARELKKKGHEPAIVSSEPTGEIVDKTRQLGIKVYDWGNIKGEYDIIHGNQKEPTERAQKLIKRPTVQTIHSEHPFLERYESPARNVSHYIAIRQSIKDKYKLDNCTVIFNPVDTSRFNIEGTAEDGKTLFVGTNDPIRGKFIKELEGKNAVFVGNGFPIPPQWRIEAYTKLCKQTASVYMGRTTIEGWLCGKPCLIYNPDTETSKLTQPPDDLSVFDSSKVVDQILEVYKKVL